jgi:hypothetical protein
MQVILARLCGGPYDGDAGPYEGATPPPRLWVWDCPEAAICPAGGTHWDAIYDQVPDGQRGTAYDLEEDGPDENDFYVYRWDNPASDLSGVDDGVRTPVDDYLASSPWPHAG